MSEHLQIEFSASLIFWFGHWSGRATIQDMSDSLKYCFTLPPKINSDGIWGFSSKERWIFFHNSLPTLELQMSLIFIMITVLHLFFGRIGISKFASMVMVGLFFGTSYNNNNGEMDGRQVIFPYESQEIIGVLGWFGYVLFLFVIGVKMDISMVHRAGSKEMNVAVLAILVPFFLGFATKFLAAPKILHEQEDVQQLSNVVSIFSLTAFPVIYAMLSELNILNSELGRLGLSTSIISDMLSVAITVMFSLGGVWTEKGKMKAVEDLGYAVLFILAVVFVLRPAMIWVIKRTPEGKPVKGIFVYIVILIVILAGYLSHRLDQPIILGPYVIGLAVPVGPPLGTAIIDKLDTFATDVFFPIFVCTCAMRANLKDLVSGWDDLMLVVSVLAVVTVILKLMACIIAPMYYRMPFKDALAFSLIMSTKGIVELSSYVVFTDAKVIQRKVLTLLTVFILFIAIMVPVLLKLLYDPSRKYAGYTRRTVMDMRDNTELRLVSCIHRSDDIPSMINLLIALCPTKEEPLGVYALHLIELIGRATPVFISHQLQSRNSNSCSEKLLVAFNQFERQFMGSVSCNSFTALSPNSLMYDDICTLALDKVASMIFLPFHRKWSEDGAAIEFEDNVTRALNCSVLNHAPCSVGILIERGLIDHAFTDESPFTICLIYLGGLDDREALSLAKRMAKEAYIKLTVVRLVDEKQSDQENDMHVDQNNWTDDIDSQMIKDVRNSNEHVRYTEKFVKDGPDTALVVRSLVQQFDLIMVGRNYGMEYSQTTGLQEWSEFQELGVLGDLLASTDISSNAGVLVVQQQQLAS